MEHNSQVIKQSEQIMSRTQNLGAIIDSENHQSGHLRY